MTSSWGGLWLDTRPAWRCASSAGRLQPEQAAAVVFVTATPLLPLDPTEGFRLSPEACALLLEFGVGAVGVLDEVLRAQLSGEVTLAQGSSAAWDRPSARPSPFLGELGTGRLSLRLALGQAQGWLWADAHLGGLLTGVARLTGLGTWLLESLDPLLLLGELAGAALLLALAARLPSLLGGRPLGYADVLTFCQARGLSVAELASLSTFVLGFLAFDAFVNLPEDDTLEAVSYAFGGILALTLLLLNLGVDLQYYYLISCISGAELTLRTIYTDLINNGLCLLRIFFCWVRYVFYDLQSELVDFAFHYTELAEELALGGAPARPTGLWAAWAGLG
jgi:hypothetical protein